jgi:hypothetical protein
MHLIYSRAFEALAKPLKDYFYDRLRKILSGEDESRDFAHLTATDRKGILEILQDTKPDFAVFLSK